MLTIRPAEAGDEAVLLKFIRDLAVYEKLEHLAVANEADLARDLFGRHPRVFSEIAAWHGIPAGFSLWFYNYSTFRGRHGIYLEDLFVEPGFRGKGIGKALIAALAQRCVAENLGRLEWSVLDWNTPSIDFYKSQGAVLMDEWTTCRVDGEALATLGRREE